MVDKMATEMRYAADVQLGEHGRVYVTYNGKRRLIFFTDHYVMKGYATVKPTDPFTDWGAITRVYEEGEL